MIVSAFTITIALTLQPDPAMLRRVFEEAVEESKRQHGTAHARTAQATYDLGAFLLRNGDPSAARAVLEESVRILRTPEAVAELASISNGLAAERLWVEAARSSNPGVAARALAVLGSLREAAGDRAKAEGFYRAALIKEEAAAGSGSVRVAARLNTLSLLVEPEEAVALLQRALRISIATVGEHRLETASIQINLAVRNLQLGMTPEAKAIAARAASVFEELLGKEHVRTRAATAILARADEASGSRR